MSTAKLEDVFARFPGVGPKQAKRFVYFLLRQNSYFKRELVALIEEIKESGKICQSCYSFFGDKDKNQNLCIHCRKERNHKTLLVVEKELDIEAIDKTGSYDGYYFVLGGVLKGRKDEKPSEVIRIRELTVRIKNDIDENLLEELIYALPVTPDGDDTEKYIRKTVSQIVGIEKLKQSRLARGLSTGLELEYVDFETFRESLVRRDTLNNED